MEIIVQKYGGTSVADLEKIRAIAGRIAKRRKDEEGMAVILSAMGHSTDQLVGMATEISKAPDPCAMDLLLSTGEQISIALMAMTLKELGVPCETFMGFEAGFFTSGDHCRAKIRSVDPSAVKASIESGKVAIVAGFQGISESDEITTIGRGGSDTTAVALAAALGASRCEIYTDVDGVFTADPSLCKDARLLEKSSYEEMMELADAGAKVLHSRSVEMAAKYGVVLEVRSSFTGKSGTSLIPESEISEGSVISGISCNLDEAKVSIRKVPDKVGVTAAIFKPIARAGIDVDLIVQTVSEEGFTELSFTVPKDDLRRAMTLAEVAARDVDAGKVTASGDIAKISIVGLGMRSHAGVAHRMFDALAREGISIQMIGTSEIKVSVVIDMRRAEDAVKILHREFGLADR